MFNSKGYVKFLSTIIFSLCIFANCAYANGYKQLDPVKFKSDIIHIKNKLHIKNKYVVDLIYETALVESDLGCYRASYINNKKGGTFQISYTSAIELLKWLKINKPFEYKYLSSLRRGTLKDDILSNVSYGICLAILYYDYYGVVKKDISNRRLRASMWKKYYNTRKGKGSVYGYLQCCRRHEKDYS